MLKALRFLSPLDQLSSHRHNNYVNKLITIFDFVTKRLLLVFVLETVF
jgi:hypothetical protein